jgi:hypothetical protein
LLGTISNPTRSCGIAFNAGQPVAFVISKLWLVPSIEKAMGGLQLLNCPQFIWVGSTMTLSADQPLAAKAARRFVSFWSILIVLH